MNKYTKNRLDLQFKAVFRFFGKVILSMKNKFFLPSKQ